MGNCVTVIPNSGRLQKVLTIGIPVDKFGVSVQSLMGVGRLKAVSYFSFESLYVESTRERGSGGGGTPYNGVYAEAPPKGSPFFSFRYING